MRRTSALASTLALVGAGVLLLAGCSTTIDVSKIETSVQDGLAEQVGGEWTVTCPDSMEVQAGLTTNCMATSTDGQTLDINVTQDDDPRPVAGQFRAVPPLDPPTRDGNRRRQPHLTTGARHGELLAREPAALGDLITVHGNGRVVGPGVVAEHQGAREGPRLTAQVPEVIGSGGEHDTGLLLHLPPHGRLGRLPRRHEARQRREPAVGPAGLPTEQRAVLSITHQDDDRRIGAREVVGAVGGHRRDQPPS